MARLKKKIAAELRKEIQSALGELTLADQLAPLMFDKDHMAVLLSLMCSYETGGLSFTQIGDITNLGKSQKLVDTLNHLSGHGLVERTNGNYNLTDYGYSAATHADRFIEMINSDPEIASKSDLAGNLAVIKKVKRRHTQFVNKAVQQTT